MQTNFTPQQLCDPEIAVANDILRSCVHCGMCTATCPTFVTLGDELDSPRGRIYLIKDMLEESRAASEQEVTHLDRCLSCLSCMTTCPSGVDYMHLIDHARVHIEKTYRRRLPDRFIRGLLAAVLPYPQRMRAALGLARLARPFGFLLPKSGMFAKRLHAMLDLAPVKFAKAAPAEDRIYRAQGARKGRVALLAGCAQQVLAPEINAATIRLLTRLGYEVVIPPQAGCCGALDHHMGRHAAALDAARRNISAWEKELDGEGLDAVITSTSGCGTVLKDYGFLLRLDAQAESAAKISSICLDLSEFLQRAGYAPRQTPPRLKVAYHAACSLQHGQRVTEAPKILLRKAGFTVIEPKDPHLCCGSAGTYNILQPEIAAVLRRRKLETLQARQPDVIAAGNIGCLTQLAGDGVPTVHVAELLDWAAGGPIPAALGKRELL
jgi:glycolate oxidase iron-sulfur subunit